MDNLAVTASPLENSRQQATDSSLPHGALLSSYLTTYLLFLSLFGSLFLFSAIHFSCHLYCLVPYSSSLSYPSQLQFVWKYLTNNHCLFKNNHVFFDLFQSATKYCCLHYSQVCPLYRIPSPSNTAQNFQDLYRTQQNDIELMRFACSLTIMCLIISVAPGSLIRMLGCHCVRSCSDGYRKLRLCSSLYPYSKIAVKKTTDEWESTEMNRVQQVFRSLSRIKCLANKMSCPVCS